MSRKNNNPLRFGLSSEFYSEPFSENQAIEYYNAGVRFIEFSQPERRFSDDIDTKADDFRKAVNHANKYNIRFTSYHIPYGYDWDISALDEDKRIENLHRILELAEVINSIQEPEIGFILHPSFEPIQDEDREAHIEQAKKSIKYLADELEKINPNIVWAIENLPRTCLAKNSLELLDIVSVDPRMKICFDTNHSLQENNINFLDAIKDRLVCLHISDYDKVNERHWAPGTGVIDWEAFNKKLAEIDFKGPLTFEVNEYCNGEDRGKITLSDLRQIYFDVLDGE